MLTEFSVDDLLLVGYPVAVLAIYWAREDIAAFLYFMKVTCVLGLVVTAWVAASAAGQSTNTSSPARSASHAFLIEWYPYFLALSVVMLHLICLDSIRKLSIGDKPR